jgi:DNA invertase Pin-like site-specific DNA recombinase
MNNCIIYTRVSTDEQVEGKSLDNQLDACTKFAEQNRWAIAQVFTEKGVSAKTTDRAELIKLLKYCTENKGKVSHLIVWKLDRFARKAQDHLALKAVLSKVGVKVVSVTENIEDTNSGKLMETVLAAFAEFDNDVRTERTTKGIRARMDEGAWPFFAPLGYKNYKDQLSRPTLKAEELQQNRYGCSSLRSQLVSILRVRCTKLQRS